MNIELSSTPNWLKITWSFFDAAVETEIVRRLNTVPGALGNGRRWFAPVSQLWRLTELFDKASFQYEAMCAADAPAKPSTQPAPLQGPLSDEDRRWGVWLNGVHNAAKKEELETVKYPKRRRTAKRSKDTTGQGGLEL